MHETVEEEAGWATVGGSSDIPKQLKSTKVTGVTKARQTLSSSQDSLLPDRRSKRLPNAAASSAYLSSPVARRSTTPLSGGDVDM